MLVAIDLAGLDGFIEFVGVDEGLAGDFQDADLSLVGEAVEGGGTDAEALADLFTGVVSGFAVGFGLLVGFGDGFGDDGLEEVFEGFADHIVAGHNLFVFWA